MSSLGQDVGTKHAAKIAAVPYATFRGWLRKLGPEDRAPGAHARFDFGELVGLRLLGQLLGWGVSWSYASRLARSTDLIETVMQAQREDEAGKPGEAASLRWLYLIRKTDGGRVSFKAEYATAEDVAHDLEAPETIAEAVILVDLVAIRAHVAARLAEVGPRRQT